MGDDFDLFPKRENLDPFSFGTSEKKVEEEKDVEDLFGQEEVSPLLPDLPLGDAGAGGPVTTGPPVSPPVSTPEHPQEMAGSLPHRVSPPGPKGPIPEEKTFDEPVPTPEPLPEKVEKKRKKAPFPFVVVGGALVIILGLLYGALTFMKRDNPPTPPVALPAVSVTLPAQMPSPAPVLEPAKPPEPAVSEPPAEPGPTPAPSEQEPAIPPEVKPAPAAPGTAVKPQPVPPVSTTVVTLAKSGSYSVQVGALVLKSSVRELEKQVAALGYETFQTPGSTTAMMNMLTVGPFSGMDEARKALSLIRESGVESNLTRRSDGVVVINAGSYLLEENASGIRKKIQAMGYPVELDRNEARLPMTFVRVGHFGDMDEANLIRDELMGKGLDAVVVKLQ